MTGKRVDEASVGMLGGDLHTGDEVEGLVDLIDRMRSYSLANVLATCLPIIEQRYPDFTNASGLVNENAVKKLLEEKYHDEQERDGVEQLIKVLLRNLAVACGEATHVTAETVGALKEYVLKELRSSLNS